jgi:hypothetical protein
MIGRGAFSAELGGPRLRFPMLETEAQEASNELGSIRYDLGAAQGKNSLSQS